MDLLAISERSVQSWTQGARKFEKDQQQAAAFDLWLDCVEQKQIAEKIGMSEATISTWFSSRKSAETEPPESRQHFDVWDFATTSDDAGTGSPPVAVSRPPSRRLGGLDLTPHRVTRTGSQALHPVGDGGAGVQVR